MIKTHCLKKHVPFTREARYIAVTRDPKDCAVSGYRFLQALALGPLMPRIENWIAFALSPDWPDSWADHLAGWWEARREPNVRFITYEQRKRDHAGLVRKIAEFMGVDLTPAELVAVVEQSTFASMKAAQHKSEPGLVVPWGRENAMMRRGATGGSSELLTPELQRRIDEHCRSELARLGCDFPYDAEYGARAVGGAGTQLTAA